MQGWLRIIDDAPPLNSNRIRGEDITVRSPDSWICQFELGKKRVRSRTAQGDRKLAGQPNDVSVEEPAIMIVQAEPVAAGQRHRAVRIRDKAHVTVLDDDGVGQAASDAGITEIRRLAFPITRRLDE